MHLQPYRQHVDPRDEMRPVGETHQETRGLPDTQGGVDGALHRQGQESRSFKLCRSLDYVGHLIM